LDQATTLIYKESAQAPNVVRTQFELNQGIIDKLVARFSNTPPKFLITCARGSSYHAATFARSLFELELGIIGVASTPSVNTIYGRQLNLDGTLFLTVSQSGESTDLIMQAKAAKQAGAFVLAVVNSVNSPLCAIADAVLPIHAGPENSVAATKSYIGSLSNIALLVSNMKRDETLKSALYELPNSLEFAAQLNWSRGIDKFKDIDKAFILGRGPCLAIACEAALKMKETCGIHAEAFSSAEVMHGPMTLIQNDFPVLIFNPQDEAFNSNAKLIERLADRNSNMLVVDNACANPCGLPSTKPLHPRLDPIVMIQSFYQFVSRLSLLRGFDPDKPRYLSKVTSTI